MSRLAKAGYIAATVVVVAVVLASLGAYAVYRRLDGNVSVVKVNGLSHRSVYGAQNILILGSQTRDGQRAGDLGSNPSLNTSNSDNLLLVHLNATHTQAIVLSIPRDTMVYEPGCKARRTIGTGDHGALPVRDHRRGDEHRRPVLRGQHGQGPDRHPARPLRRVQLQLLPRDGGHDRRGGGLRPAQADTTTLTAA